MRAAVIGVGGMGQHHARVFNELDDVELVGVADIDPVRAEAVGRRFKVPTWSDPEEMLRAVCPDLVSVVVPTAYHHEVASKVIARGVHLLVEKPIARNVAEAQDLIAAAAACDVRLAVGHVERFNAAVIELRRRLDADELGTMFQIHAQRLSSFPKHVQDVGVVMDLATHELDIMRCLADGEAEYVFASVGRKIHPLHEDMLSCFIQFTGGAVGVVDINWLTPTKVRQLRVTGTKGMFLADYLTQDLYFYENAAQSTHWDALALLKGVEEGNVIKINVTKVEPLRAELTDLVSAVREHRSPAVTGQDGLETLRLAEALLLSGRERRAIQLLPVGRQPSGL